MPLAAAQCVQNRAGGHVANSVRFQKVLATAILKGFKWQQVQYAVWCNEKPISKMVNTAQGRRRRHAGSPAR